VVSQQRSLSDKFIYDRSQPVAEQKKYLHEPIRSGDRDSWLVSEVDEAGAKTPLGIRPQSSGNALDGAIHGSSFTTMTSLPISNRALPDGPVVEHYELTPDPARPLIAKVLDPAGPLTHQRTECPACHAERGHELQLPPALPFDSPHAS
jgi:hypothetical protein